MNNIILNEKPKIEEMIYEIRGNQVMLDSDLAKLYECTNGTKDINKTVKRNIERFPSDFYFQLTKEEYQNLKFQNGTSMLNTHGGIRKLPYVFTEHCGSSFKDLGKHCFEISKIEDNDILNNLLKN